ncbi:PREDICTED: subtilisin-like protease SBT2.5 isoform X1 [Lupinus angustifolius]|uniref:subtilisin-like protease SBT2.5 isoform X1 n=1 Tax=Lupinus angustifolius TaxID=3871 RepID=UPI00092E3E99|nr:PREDICTED: subtilisin-like protease SBT2.5 isoform X1 [Lupinus angustifolius]
MESTKSESYFVFMNYDPEYQRLLNDRTKRGTNELDLYLNRKHDEVLARTLEPGSYKKTCSFVIVDGFEVEITEDQANVLRSVKEVRVVEKNEEFP